jgi:hypothetical protein
LLGSESSQADRIELSAQALAEFELASTLEPLPQDALEIVLNDFAAIVAGETNRAEMQARFQLDGGLHSPGLMRFIHPLCRYCKVDALFEFERNADDQCRAISSEYDLVVELSNPYIEHPSLD